LESGKPHDLYSYALAGITIRFRAKDTDGDGILGKVDLCPGTLIKLSLVNQSL